MIKAVDLKKRYLDFFIKKEHKLLPNVSLLPENDSSALFINSGMHPLVSYFLGESHPLGKRLVSNQRCLRTQDIESIGDTSHLTFFEMLGNWSLGDYWKRQVIGFSFEFLTKQLDIDINKISVSCFAGDSNAPKDEESAKIWESLGIPKSRIYFLPKKDNWWAVGENGPCGPDTEMFYDTGKKACGVNCQPGDNCGKYLEIWNNVFMEFNRLPDGKLENLKHRNIDTGMGVERTVAILQGKDDVYQTELFVGLLDKIETLFGKKYEGENQKLIRILADHLRAATFAIADGVTPGNVEQGYVIRRLLRKAIFTSQKMDKDQQNVLSKLAQQIIKDYQDQYPHLAKDKQNILTVLADEEAKFAKTLKQGIPKIEKFVKENKKVTGLDLFNFRQTYGIPQDLFLEIAGINDPKDQSKLKKEFETAFGKHQQKSRASLGKKFAGGLADHSQDVVKLHTAAHLLHQALREVLGKEVNQAGSNITPERLRFDFTYPEKLTEDQLKAVENLINQQISKDLAVKMEIMSLEDAQKAGALAFFIDKYGQKVKVYSIGNFSKEVCGGPHVDSLAKIGEIKIIKEGSSGAGKRRIYAGFSKK